MYIKYIRSVGASSQVKTKYVDVCQYFYLFQALSSSQLNHEVVLFSEPQLQSSSTASMPHKSNRK